MSAVVGIVRRVRADADARGLARGTRARRARADSRPRTRARAGRAPTGSVRRRSRRRTLSRNAARRLAGTRFSGDSCIGEPLMRVQRALVRAAVLLEAALQQDRHRGLAAGRRAEQQQQAASDVGARRRGLEVVDDAPERLVDAEQLAPEEFARAARLRRRRRCRVRTSGACPRCTDGWCERVRRDWPAGCRSGNRRTCLPMPARGAGGHRQRGFRRMPRGAWTTDVGLRIAFRSHLRQVATASTFRRDARALSSCSVPVQLLQSLTSGRTTATARLNGAADVPPLTYALVRTHGVPQFNRKQDFCHLAVARSLRDFWYLRVVRPSRTQTRMHVRRCTAMRLMP